MSRAFDAAALRLGDLQGRGAGEAGFTLIELLVVMALGMVIFGAVLGTLETALRQSNVDQSRLSEQDAARNAIDSLSRQLRDAASPSAGSAGALEKAGPYDIVFQTVSSGTVFGNPNATNLMRVRYCLDNSNPASENLYMQTETWTTSSAPSVPDTSACPSTSSSWSSTWLAATNLTNEYNGQSRPAFIFAPLGSTSTAVIDGIEVDLFLNPSPTQLHPGETELKSGIFLRNSNAPPTASFTATAVNGYVYLNGSGSTDPNGQSLTYQWTVDGAAPSSGNTQSYTAGSYTSGSTHTFSLTVKDPSGLTATAATQTLTIP